MTKSQQAMAMAMLYPEPVKTKRKGAGSSNFEELSSGYISQARTVLRVLPSVAQEVISGGLRVDQAYQQARDIEAKSNSVESRLEALRQQFPDI